MPAKRRSEAEPRPTLTPHAVVAAALAVADAEGLEQLTMRRLASTLGVTPMALYWHFRSKDELLDAMVTTVFERTSTALDRGAPWPQQLRALLRSLVDAVARHPGAATLVSTRTVTSAAALDVTELLLDILRRAGFSPSEATQVARHALSTTTNLVAAPSGVVAAGADAAATERQARQLLGSLPADRYPRLAEAAEPLTRGVAREDYVAFGLELLLAGIEALALARPRARPASRRPARPRA